MGVGSTATGKCCNSYLDLYIETVFTALKLTLNCYLHYNINIFFENWQFIHKLALSFLRHMLYWKTILTVWQNLKAKGDTSKIPVFKLLSEFEEISKGCLGYPKIAIFHLIYELGKTWKYTQPKLNISKSKFWIYIWIGQGYRK